MARSSSPQKLSLVSVEMIKQSLDFCSKLFILLVWKEKKII